MSVSPCKPLCRDALDQQEACETHSSESAPKDIQSALQRKKITKAEEKRTRRWLPCSREVVQGYNSEY